MWITKKQGTAPSKKTATPCLLFKNRCHALPTVNLRHNLPAKLGPIEVIDDVL